MLGSTASIQTPYACFSCHHPFRSGTRPLVCAAQDRTNLVHITKRWSGPTSLPEQWCCLHHYNFTPGSWPQALRGGPNNLLPKGRMRPARQAQPQWLGSQARPGRWFANRFFKSGRRPAGCRLYSTTNSRCRDQLSASDSWNPHWNHRLQEKAVVLPCERRSSTRPASNHPIWLFTRSLLLRHSLFQW